MCFPNMAFSVHTKYYSMYVAIVSQKGHNSRPISLFNASRQSCVNEYGLLHQMCGFTNHGITLAANEREIYNRFYNREWNAKYSHCFDSIWFQFNLIYVIAFADGGNFAADFFFHFAYVCLWKGRIYFYFYFLITPNGRYRVKCTVNQTEPTSFIQHLLLLYDVVALHIKSYYNFAFHLRMLFSLRKLKGIIKRR